MRISPKYSDDDWKQLSFSTEEEWHKAIAIFLDRINGRFFDPMTCLVGQRYAGFVILALDCLLIETLQQFQEGKPQTPRRESEEYFVRFLTETSFGQWFSTETARTFYDQIRCGILHQAELKGSSRVLVRQCTPVVCVSPDGQGLVINRNLFHQQLEQEFHVYVSRLQDPSEQELRARFKKKMDYICRVSAETQ